MTRLLTWMGLGIFSLALAYDFWSEWLAPRALSRSWFPGEPDLPPVAGDVDDRNPDPDNYWRVVLAGYYTGGAVLIIGLLDIAPVQPACLPYAGFVKTYVMGIFVLATGFLWFSDGQDVVMPYHAGIRYSIGVLTVIVPMYMKACGSGVL